MQITSPAFGPNQSIPSQYTCDGQGKNPTLEWAEAPASAKSFVMILDDPDAPSGDFVHWLVFNIPADVTRIAEGEAPSGVIGRSSLGTNAYVSPCPPSGRHRYFFKLFALDSLLDLPAASTKAQVELAMQGHILDQTELIGLYQR